MILLALAAKHGRWVLICGVVFGLAFPGPSQVFLPYLPVMAGGLLLFAMLRVDPERLNALRAGAGRATLLALILQLALPLLVIVVGALLGVLSHPALLALVLMTAAPSIASAPNLCVMMGRSPGPALRLMVIGTAILPLTVLPVFFAMPGLGDPGAVLFAALRLLALIVLSAAVAWAITRSRVPLNPAAVDGASAILLAVFAVGLMTALATLWRVDPLQALWWLGFALLANFGLQLSGHVTMRKAPPDDRAAIALIAGNRNIALFLVALPAETTAPILIFIACYQVPMYVTPLLLGRLYGRG